MKVIEPHHHLGVRAKTLAGEAGKRVTVAGIVQRVRKMGGLMFVVIRNGQSSIQCKLEPGGSTIPPESYAEGNTVKASGICRLEPRAPHGAEVEIENVTVLSRPFEPAPFSVNLKTLGIGLDTNLDYRSISLRHETQRAIFVIQFRLAELFRQALMQIGFTEIFSPKIVFAGAEGGANTFGLDYFGRRVCLAQSPQFYKQMMVGVFGRVMEVGPVFRAEPHETARHLNEYVSMDLEMGPIDSFVDVMEVETFVLRYIFAQLSNYCQAELDLLGVSIPQVGSIPRLTVAEALDIASRTGPISDRNDLDMRSEQAVCQYVWEQTGSELVFVTHYPTEKRPFYAMEDPADPSVTLSFDLLFRGLEITTGGQRIHNYEQQVDKLRRFGHNPDDFTPYLQIHRYGIPPHGGLGLGLERLTMQLLGLKSVKEASLFPRTMNRVTP